MKKFTINCDFGGQFAPFTIFIGNPEANHHPLHFQADWLSKQRGGTIPAEIMDSIGKLKDLALKNNVSLAELCVYALGSAEEELAEENANNDFERNFEEPKDDISELTASHDQSTSTELTEPMDQDLQDNESYKSVKDDVLNVKDTTKGESEKVINDINTMELATLHDQPNQEELIHKGTNLSKSQPKLRKRSPKEIKAKKDQKASKSDKNTATTIPKKRAKVKLKKIDND